MDDYVPFIQVSFDAVLEIRVIPQTEKKFFEFSSLPFIYFVEQFK